MSHFPLLQPGCQPGIVSAARRCPNSEVGEASPHPKRPLVLLKVKSTRKASSAIQGIEVAIQFWFRDSLERDSVEPMRIVIIRGTEPISR